MSKPKTLSSIKILAELKNEDIELLQRFAEYREYDSQQLILRQGHIGDGLYLILSGAVTVKLKLPGEKILTVDTLESGDCFGEVSLIDHGVYSTSIQSIEPVKCVYLSREQFEMLKLYEPELAIHLMESIGRALSARVRSLYDALSLLPEFNQSINIPSQRGVESSVPIKQTDAEQKFFDLLEHMTLLRDIPEPKLKQLISYTTFCEYPKYQFVDQNTVIIDSLFIIIQGAIQCVVKTEAQSSKYFVLGPNHMFGMTSMIDGVACLSSYLVREQALLLKLERSNYERLRKEAPELWFGLFERLSIQLAKELRVLSAHLTRIRSVQEAEEAKV